MDFGNPGTTHPVQTVSYVSRAPLNISDDKFIQTDSDNQLENRVAGVPLLQCVNAFGTFGYLVCAPFRAEEGRHNPFVLFVLFTFTAVDKHHKPMISIY